MESIFPTFSPLWIERSKGKTQDITSKLIRHYSARLTTEMHGGSNIKSVLTRGLKSLQSAVQQLALNSFLTDMFCSADGFIEHLLMKKRNMPSSVGRFFTYELALNYQCTKFPTHQESDRSVRAVVGLTTDLFHDANLRYLDVSKLLSLWQTEGLFAEIPRCCPTCLILHRQQQAPSTLPDPSQTEQDIQVLSVDPSSDVP
ncbi:hypothetical protein DFH28DRAFT_891914 [Melampsora americana]|nr:hypothetical protein DFH28DRAFT_891914 [Melampsora americana]